MAFMAVYKIPGRKREELIMHPHVWAVLQSSVEASRQQRKKKQEDEICSRSSGNLRSARSVKGAGDAV